MTELHDVEMVTRNGDKIAVTATKSEAKALLKKPFDGSSNIAATRVKWKAGK